MNHPKEVVLARPFVHQRRLGRHCSRIAHKVVEQFDGWGIQAGQCISQSHHVHRTGAFGAQIRPCQTSKVHGATPQAPVCPRQALWRLPPGQANTRWSAWPWHRVAAASVPGRGIRCMSAALAALLRSGKRDNVLGRRYRSSRYDKYSFPPSILAKNIISTSI